MRFKWRTAGVLVALLLAGAGWGGYELLAAKRFARWEFWGESPAGLPVFMFHEPDRDELEEVLDHLTRNHYITLGAREAEEFFSGAKPFTGREVLLTFDDGKLALWSYVWPELRKRKLKAVAFVNPGLVVHGPVRPQSDKGPDKAELTTYCSWSELQKAALEGLDVQSHSWAHEREMYRDPRVHALHQAEIKAGLLRSKDRLIAMGFGRQWLFCAPFGSVSPLLKEMVRETGYSRVVGVRPEGPVEGFFSPENAPGIPQVIRFNHRSIFSLPGDGREGVLGRMWRRLRKGGDRYE